MKRIALIHTVKSVLNSFEGQLREALPELEINISNTLDDFLLTDTLANGIFSKVNANRLFMLVQTAVQTGADIVCVTCSTLTPTVALIRPFFNVPIVAIDDAMCKNAAKMGPHIHVMASSPTTIEATCNKIEQEASAASNDIVITREVCQDAFVALNHGNMQAHDDIFRTRACFIKNVDVVVLAQASMAHLRCEIEGICGTSTLSSPASCIQEIVSLLAAK